MTDLFLNVREITMSSVSLRMLLAVLCGGLIGLERERKRRPAGFRTHILICLGASMTVLISQYLLINRHYYTDIARLGAQVVAGVGFIGAGTIIVTKHRRVKGLTTAAGLWTSAIIGLCCGAGYIEAAVGATVLILIAEILFSRLEYFIMNNSQDAKILIEYTNTDALNMAIDQISSMDVKILNMEITRPEDEESASDCAVLYLQLHRKYTIDELRFDLTSIEGILTFQEL